MSVSKAQKRSSIKWDKANMTTIGCKVTKKKAEQFKDACRRLGVVPNALLLKTIDNTIAEADALDEAEKEK